MLKKLIYILCLFSLFCISSAFANNIKEIKIEIITLNKLLKNQTLTENQFDLASDKILQKLDEYKSLKKLLIAKIIDRDQYYNNIYEILGINSTDFNKTAKNKINKNEKQLFSEALKDISNINPNSSIKDKLMIYENIIINISKIERNFPTSDISIKLRTNQSIGNFNIVKIRKQYLNELINYYDIVCEKTPSFLCIGFVSLKTGQEMCQKSSSFEQSINAHSTLLNAIKIFKGQKTKSTYLDMALVEYRNCNKNIPNISQEWIKGYFSMPLIKVLLDKDDKSITRGIIENNKDPYFKFLSVIYFKELSKEIPTLEYQNRLKKFIDDNFENFSLNASLSKLALSKFMLINGKSNFTNTDVQYAYLDGRIGPSVSKTLECGGLIMNYYHKEYLDYLLLLYQIDKKRYGKGSGWGYQFPAKVKNIGATSGVFNSCRKKKYDHKFYNISLKLFGDLLIYNGIKDALKFKEFILEKSNGNKNLVFNYYVDLRLANNQLETTFSTIPNNGDSQLSELKRGVQTWNVTLYSRNDNRKKSNLVRIKGKYDFEKFNKIIYLERFAILNKLGLSSSYKIFQSYVKFSDVCKASEILFQKLKGTKYYNDAVNYMVSNPSINNSKKYVCGDEDLELLLN